MPRILAPALLAATSLFAQEPNALPLDATYHVGTYNSEIAPPTGELRLYAGLGSMTMLPDGTFGGSLAAYETDLTLGTVAIPNDPFGGSYAVRGDGICVLDLDLANPGTDLAPLWITADDTVMHGVTGAAEPNATSVVAIQAGSGLSAATLNGTYRVVAQRLEFNASTSSGWEVEHEFGTATFDGAGGGSFTGFRFLDTGSGGGPVPTGGPFSYGVADDGALTIGSDDGACSADGELLFLLTAQPTGDVGLVIGVRVGSSYDLQELSGRYGFTGHRYRLGATSTALPESRTLTGDLLVTATSSSAGSWAFDGTAVQTAPGGQTVGPWTASGAATLTPTGDLAMTGTAASWSLWPSASGRFVVGRTPGANTHMLFATRQCPPSTSVGAGTPGAGGIAPTLGLRTFPAVGNSGFAFAVERGLGGALCAVPIATAQGPGLPAFGGTVVLDPATIGTTVAMVLGGAAGIPGEGHGLAPLPLPNTPSLAGFELWAQALVFDGAATGGVALSNGYRAVLCGQ